MPEEGIAVECVGCHKKRTIPFKEWFDNYTDLNPPMCDVCYMPVIAVSASFKSKRRATQKTSR